MSKYFGIGIYNPKFDKNIGILWRSAYLLGAAYIFILNGKHYKYSSDTQKTWKQIPCYEWKNLNIPVNAKLIGVETSKVYPKAIDLPDFKHPTFATYILGNESKGLPLEILNQCDACINIPCVKEQSYNVSMAGTLVMYDRYTKEKKK